MEDEIYKIIDRLLEAYPEKYGRIKGEKSMSYIVLNEKYGFYPKKEAEIICEFLRKNIHKLLTHYKN